MALLPEKGSFLGWVKSVFRLGWRQARKAEDARRRAEKIRLLYELFREILGINDSTLQTIATIEDGLTGRVPFSLKSMIRQIHRTTTEVSVMVKNLNQIADGRHIDLYTSLRCLNAQIDEECADLKETPSGPLVLPLSGLRAGDTALAGSKMANLGEIRNALGLNVPDGFAITTHAFARFMAHNDLRRRAEMLEEVMEVFGVRVASEACREVQTTVIAGSLPEDMEKAIVEAFDALWGGRDVLVAVRSSAAGEDQATSHAGQYQTELNVGRGWLLHAYRGVLSSVFAPGPISYRLQHGLSVADARMAVGCLRMVEPRCSGILFTRGFEDLQADRILVSIVPGLAEGLACGSANGEELTLSPDKEPAASAYLSRPELDNLARTARRIEDYFKKPQDIEWAVDRDGNLFILQSRPMMAAPPVESILKEGTVPPVEPILAGGLSACPGAASGEVYRVPSDEDLGRFPDGAVLVAPHSSPRFSQVMAHCAAIVTDYGSPAGHMAILAREFGVPSITGLKGAMQTLANGRRVTVDASSCRIYDGRIEAILSQKDAPSRLERSPAVRKLRRIAQWVTPLHLVDPASPGFTPMGCKSLHDITRFAHEKLFEAMFHLGKKTAETQVVAARLAARLPYDVWILDLGGGLTHGMETPGQVFPSDILSFPMKAFLDGFLDPRIRWDQPRAVSGRGFLSVLGESMAGLPPEVRGVGKASFAAVSDRYMNFSTQAGYHFNTVDTYCGQSLNKNYIHFRFTGGGAQEARRARRCRFLSSVLTGLGFKVQCRQDVIVARLEKYDREFLSSRLVELGRLTLCARQLDMLMDTDASADFFAKAFLSGEMERF